MGSSATSGLTPPALPSSTRTTENLETFSLLWLDENVNSTEQNINAQKKLKTVMNQLKTFENTQVYQQYIQQNTSTNSIVLIVSGKCGRELIPTIHELSQLNAIYVYCMDIKSNEVWTKNYRKVS